MQRLIHVLLLGRPPGAAPDAWLRGSQLALGWVAAAAVIGIAARLLAAAQGHNYDVESYWIVSGIVDSGGNVYAETHRYNYGPAWFVILGALRQIAELFDDPFVALRYLVAALLTIADLAIAWMLATRFGRLTAVLVLLHPLAILITGYHSQFDNVAIAVGLAGVLLLERADRAETSTPGDHRAWLSGVVVVGLSLVFKHLLVVLPLWLALRQRSLVRAGIVLVLPLAMLLGSFLPFVAEGWEGISANVIGYRSAANEPFHAYLLPHLVGRHVSPTMLFGGVLLILGWWWRRRPPVEQLLLYTVVVTIFTPGMYTQYLAIPVAATVAFMNAGYLVYVVIGTLFLLASPVNLGIPQIAELLPGFLVRAETGDVPYGYLVALLVTGVAIHALELYRLDRRTGSTA